MTIVPNAFNTEQLLLNVTNSTLRITPDEFDKLCIDNPDLRLELNKNEELIVMPPTGGETGERNGNLFARVWIWNDQTKLGRAFDSSTGYDFTAIGGGKLSPDVSWIEKSRLNGIDIKGFIPVVPDFVIELRSRTDRLTTLQAKMLQYRRLGVRLGLLVDPQDKQVEIYQLGKSVMLLESPASVDCNTVLRSFVLDLTEVL